MTANGSAEMKNNLAEIRKNMATKDDIVDIHKTMATKQDVTSIQYSIEKKLTKLFDFLDKDVMDTKKRIRRIEEHLHLSIPQ